LKAAGRTKDLDNGMTAQLRLNEVICKLHTKHADNLRKQIAVIARNRQKSPGCNRAPKLLSREMNDPADRKVFCVSSEQYLQHLRPFPLLDLPVLPLHLTGIVQLCYFIQTSPSRSGRTDAFVHHSLNVVPGVLNAITLSCTGFSL
jgi:hypothetical protein